MARRAGLAVQLGQRRGARDDTGWRARGRRPPCAANTARSASTGSRTDACSSSTARGGCCFARKHPTPRSTSSATSAVWDGGPSTSSWSTTRATPTSTAGAGVVSSCAWTEHPAGRRRLAVPQRHGPDRRGPHARGRRLPRTGARRLRRRTGRHAVTSTRLGGSRACARRHLCRRRRCDLGCQRPRSRLRARVEGGEVLDAVTVDRGCFACMLGGEDGRTLFIAAAEWRGMEAAMTDGPGSTGQLLAAPGQPAPHAGRP